MMVRTLLLCLFFGLQADLAHAQLSADSARTRIVRIIHADSSAGEVVDGRQVRKLVGHVHLEQEGTHIWTREALQDIAERLFVLRGGVRIVDRERDTLRAALVRYDERRRWGEARGGVVFTDGEVRVHAPSGAYDLQARKVWFREGVHLQDSLTTLTSRAGVYDIEARVAYFWGEVHLVQDEVHIEADTVEHFRESGYTRAVGKVVLYRLDEDSAAVNVLFGNRLDHERTRQVSHVEGNPLFVRLVREGVSQDTLVLRARRFSLMRTDSLDRLIAVEDVRLWQRKLAARGDSLAYLRYRDTTRFDRLALYGEPRGWSHAHQVTGDTLKVYLRRTHPQRLEVWEHVYVGMPDSVLDRIHQVRGRWMEGHFVADTLRRVFIGPQAEAVYFLREEDRTLAGAVEVSADTLRVQLAGEQPERIVAVGGIAGTYYDRGQVPADLGVEGFRWLIDERPRLEALLPSDSSWHERLRQLLTAIWKKQPK